MGVMLFRPSAALTRALGRQKPVGFGAGRRIGVAPTSVRTFRTMATKQGILCLRWPSYLSPLWPNPRPQAYPSLKKVSYTDNKPGVPQTLGRHDHSEPSRKTHIVGKGPNNNSLRLCAPPPALRAPLLDQVRQLPLSIPCG